MLDYSFIRFKETFEEAKDLGDHGLLEAFYGDQIHLLPTEVYRLISNCENGIAFDGNYKAYIVDFENTVLYNITDKVLIEEFTHNENGLQQIKLEILPTEIEEYTNPLFLRLDHDVVGGKSYWSNCFLISEYDEEETSTLEFSNYQNLDGTAYEVTGLFKQFIRLKMRKQKDTFSSLSQSYTTLEGIKQSSRLIKTKFNSYIIDRCNDFIYNRLQYVLSHDVIYANGIRVTDKQTFDSDDKYSDTTNVAQCKFKVPIDESDTRTGNSFEIYESLYVTSRIPTHLSTLSSTDGAFELTFNKNINVVPLTRAKLYRNGVHVTNCTVVASVNKLLVSYAGSYTFDNAEYYITIPSNTVWSDDTFPNEFWNGYTDNEWKFTFNSSQLEIIDVYDLTIPGGDTLYYIQFTSNFTFMQLKSQLKWDELGVWTIPYTHSGITSPQTRPISGFGTNQKIRIFAVDPASGLTVYSNEFNY